MVDSLRATGTLGGCAAWRIAVIKIEQRTIVILVEVGIIGSLFFRGAYVGNTGALTYHERER